MTISLLSLFGEEYQFLLYDSAILIVHLLISARGWHLDENHILVDGQPMSGSIFDFGLYFFHNAKELIALGYGPYF